MKKIALPLAAALLLFAGCSTTPTTNVAPGDGPAAEQTEGQTFDSPPADEPTADETSEAPMDDESTEEPTEEPTDEESEEEFQTATFKQKYVYTDGVEIEIIKIKRGQISAYDAEINDNDTKAGDPYVVFTVRVKNGTNKRLDLSASGSVSYGPDGEAAESSFLEGADDLGLTGTVLPGKSKSSESSAWLIPSKYQDDVVYEFSPDFDHDSAVFAGTVK